MTLKSKVLSGTRWLIVANVVRQTLNIGSMVVFARILSPDDFGAFAIVMMFAAFLLLFSDMGTGAVLIHIDDPSDLLLSSLLYFNILIGMVLFFILYLSSGIIAHFFHLPILDPLLQLLAVNFIILSFSIVQKSLFQKKLEFKILTILETSSLFISIVVGIIMALNGFGVYSLVAQILVSSLVLTIMLWGYSTWKPQLLFSIKEIKKVFNYIVNLTGFSFVNYFASNADNFLIGKFLGSSSLGVYSLAYKIMLFPLQQISQTLLRVLFPAFSQIKHDNEKFKKAYLKVIFFIALVSFPLMMGLVAVSDVFVSVVFGEKWKDLALILTILAPIGMLKSISTTLGSIYLAKGTTDRMFWIGTIGAMVTVSCIVAGIPFGVVGVAYMLVLANLIMLYPNFKYAWIQIDLDVKEGLIEVIPVLFISILMYCGVKLFDYSIGTYFDSQPVRLSMMIITGIIIYIVLLRFRYNNLMILLKELKK